MEGKNGKFSRWLFVAHSFPLTSPCFLVSFFILLFPISLSLLLFLLLCSFFNCIFFFLHFSACLELQGVSISTSTEGFSSSLVFIKKASSSYTFLYCASFLFLSVGMSKYVFVLHIFVIKTIFVLVV